MTVHDELNVNFSFHRNCWNPLHGYQRNRDLREKKKKKLAISQYSREVTNYEIPLT